MKLRSERQSLERLGQIKSRLRSEVADGYENKAKSCVTCATPGACCLDAHFVNVRISRLEAVAINNYIDDLPQAAAIRDRIDATIAAYQLTSDADNDNKFACPLFEKGTGCIVHDVGKPVPCIVHACYESPEDMPPSKIADDAELAVDLLNTQTYGRPQPLLPIPLALNRTLG